VLAHQSPFFLIGDPGMRFLRMRILFAFGPQSVAKLSAAAQMPKKSCTFVE